jgi:hypothetical protein
MWLGAVDGRKKRTNKKHEDKAKKRQIFRKK